MFFQYGVGAYFWAAIFDFKVTMVQNIVKSFYYISITFMMPELTGNYTSFAFLSSLYQEMSLFLVFNVASAAILGCHLEFESQDRPKMQWISIYQICKARIRGKWCFTGLKNPSGWRKITAYVFKYGVGDHYWATILDLNVKRVSEYNKSLSIRSGMPNLVGKVTLFAF